MMVQVLCRLICAAVLLVAAQATPQPRPDELLVRQNDDCQALSAGSPKTWWRAQIGHNGTTPYAADSGFQYYRTVVQYGADNSGNQDASDAFNQAINAGNRAGNTVTTMPVYIYVPPGTYLIKKPIQMLVSTFLVGDPLSPPTLVADPALGGKPVINGYDDHQGDNGATKNFYMAVRNFNIDTTRVAADVVGRAIDWSVSQACSLTNVHIKMPPSSGHIGITMEQGGSGTIISDCSFTGGAIGLQLANQQYLLKGLKFDGCSTGIFIRHSYVTTIQGCSFTSCNFGVDLSTVNSSGTVSIVDSSVSKCTVGVNTYVSGNGEGSLVLDNFDVSDAIAVRSSTGTTLLQGSVPAVWVMGNVTPDGYQTGKTVLVRRPPGLLADGKYFTAPLPQYEKYDISQVVSIKGDPDHPVYGDNLHDDGPAINAILAKHAGCKIVFFPQGIYRTNVTIFVPPGSRLIGEVYSVISGAGALFAVANNPQPVVKLGRPGDRGVAQLTDLLISVADVLPGAILLQINIAGPNPGDVGVWSSSVRVGGSIDTSITATCASPSSPAIANCKAAFALLHITPTGAAYLENLWGWVADHALDNPNPSSPPPPTQNIAVGRGALLQNTNPTWLLGTAFEHATLYQYALHSAQNTYLALHQSESPYWQGQGNSLPAPAPWTANPAFPDDPSFAHCVKPQQGFDGARDDARCYRAFGMHIAHANNTVIHGSAMWAFFNGMSDGSQRDPQCGATGEICQADMAWVEGAGNLWWFSLGSKSSANVVVEGGGEGDGSVVGAVVSQADYGGGWGAVVAAYLRDQAPPAPSGGHNGSDNGGGSNKGDPNVVDGGGEQGKDSGAGRGALSGLGWAVMAVGMGCAAVGLS